MLGKHAKLTDDLRQFVVAGRVKSEGDFAFAGFFRLDDMAVIGGLLRAIFLESVERKDYVGGRDRCAVMPLGFRAQPVCHRRKIRGEAHSFGQ